MKLHIAAVVFVAAGVLAAPKPNDKRDALPEAEPWCFRVFQNCWKVKRTADAFTASIRSSGSIQARSPEAQFSNLPGGAAFAFKRSLTELANLIALAQNDPVSFYTQLELENHLEHDSKAEIDAMTGGKEEKRDAKPEPWCFRVFQTCWKRDAAPESTASKDKRWCLGEGQTCWKAKRAAEAVLEAIGDVDDDGADAHAFDPTRALHAAARSIIEAAE